MGSQNGKTDLKCNHRGKWLGLGTLLMTVQTKFILLHNLFCSECGETKMVLKEIPIPKEPGISIPIPVVFPGGGGGKDSPGGSMRNKS